MQSFVRYVFFIYFICIVEKLSFHNINNQSVACLDNDIYLILPRVAHFPMHRY